MSKNYNTMLKKYNVKSHKKYCYGGGKVNISFTLIIKMYI